MTERSDDPPSVARVWIDMRDSGRVTLYLTGDRADRLLVRHVPLVTRIDEVAREEVAHIVEATVDALLVGGRIGVVTDEVMRPGARSEPPLLPREHPGGLRLDLGVAYEAQVWKEDRSPLHSAAIMIGTGARTGVWRPGVWLSAEYRFPTTVENELVTARLDQGAFRAIASLDWAASRRWFFGGGAGGGFDLVRIAPDAHQESQVQPTDPRFSAVPMVRLLLMARYAFSSRSHVFAGVAGDYDLLGTRYILVAPSGADVVFEPWRVRPTALVGVTSDVLAH